MSSGDELTGMRLQQHLIELRIQAHHGPVSGRDEARQEYERLLKTAVRSDPYTSWQDLDIALGEPYRVALKKREQW